MSENSEVKFGIVVWMDAKKGFGFVKPDEEDQDIFVHWSNIEMDGFKNLKAEQRVSFELGKNHRGVQCVNVKILDEVE